MRRASTHQCEEVPRSIVLIDSMQSEGGEVSGVFRKSRDALFFFLEDEAKSSGVPFTRAEWSFPRSHRETPQQTNAYDCGVFVVMAACYISLGMPLMHLQRHVPHYRALMALDLSAGYADSTR